VLAVHVARFNLLDHLPTNDNLWIVARKAGRQRTTCRISKAGRLGHVGEVELAMVP
jgi:hypothetical protein